jgi:ATP-dependent Clp endopeptidase proteolytic subunit ClpP
MPQTNKSWYEFNALANGNAEIYVYDEIGFWGITAKDFARDLKEIDPKSEINLRINSPGGSVTDGIAIFNLLKNHKATVNVYVDGLAASMASVIAMAGDTITMPENALMMIHNPWGGAMGDADELRKTADVLDKMKVALISAYSSKTGLDADAIAEMMTAETWMTGSEALEIGFATQVVDEVQLAASFDLDKLNQFQSGVREKFNSAKETSSTMTIDVKVAGLDDAEKRLKDFHQNVMKSAPADKPKEEISMPEATNTPATNVADKEALQAKAIADYKAKEAKRKEGINSLFASFKHQYPELLASCLEDEECTKEQASAKLLDELGKEQEPQQGGFNAAVYAGNGDIVKESMSAAIKAKAGIKVEQNELTHDNPYRAMSLMEMARAALNEKGVGTAAYGDRMSLVGAAFTHGNSDFPHVLADVANKSMLQGFEEANETFQLWTRQGSLSDFKVSKRVGLNDFASLPEVRPGAEYTYGTVGERAENIALATYGKLFSINRQAIINDDLAAFTRIPFLMGQAAIRTVGDLVYAILTSNPTMSDGNSLFHAANHKNLQTGAGSALQVSSLEAARTAMRKQKLDKGNALGIRPEFLLVPAALESKATKLMRDTVLPGASNGESNPVSGMAQVISEARLDDSSATAWYLAAGAMYDTIEVAYLDGNNSPFLDQMDGFTVDGTTMKVRIDAGVAPLEYRTLYKGVGA